jgi:tryptophanase
MFGRQPDGSEEPAKMGLIRLAVPRRVYNQCHVDYVIECFEEVYERREEVAGYEIIEEPTQLRHLTAHFRPLAPELVHRRTGEGG